MNNAELIDELRGHILSVPLKLLHDAADALEAAERLLDQNTKRCEALRKQLRESHESYEQRIAELDKRTKLPDRQEFLAKGSFIEEPLSRPKEGEWIMACLAPQMDANKIGQWAYAPKCSECGSLWDAKTKYCPNCGARMRGEHDEQIH